MIRLTSIWIFRNERPKSLEWVFAQYGAQQGYVDYFLVVDEIVRPVLAPRIQKEQGFAWDHSSIKDQFAKQFDILQPAASLICGGMGDTAV